ncbi:endopeptidase La [Petroclostridium sp. X23]|uniref:endopeptidase La n=1 Tax=Petroclostridium sp. X23 TaxID=3045146 RepID=UPI0024ACF2F6|nr:endopeptidase La [Petroclostridium sp. X23]WHH60251.1 endopeptidase La [Petroclostridium sp. X23]
MAEGKKIIKKQVLPLLPLRGLTVFPYMILHFDVGRAKSIKALEEAMINNQLIFLVTQKDIQTDDPQEDDVFKIGTISKIKQLLKLPGDTIRVLVEGLSRAEITEIMQSEPFVMSEVVERIVIEPQIEKVEMEAIKRKIHSVLEEYFQLSNKISPDTMVSVMTIEDPGQLADVIAANIVLKQEDKQQILTELNPRERLEQLIVILSKEVQILEVEKNISVKVKKQIDKNQREYYLREQLKAIQNELGDKDGIMAEVEEYKEKIAQAKLPEEVEKKALKEVDRLLKMHSGSAEGSVVRNYLDWVLDLPWNTTTEEQFDIKQAEEILESDHYGLEKVKDRILEYLAVRYLAKGIKGPILCLVGPPGVGKTSIAKSIAKALNRKYVRMSLGGVRDEAEIRGHRRTYVGSMPGRIINALKQAGSKNALVLLDEIDKMSSDFRGDPASAMLEVLDAEQNYAFRDHYLEVPFNLSEILFLTTANSLDTIPRPLLDRMEVLHISGYTEEEKVNIAVKYLLPKQMENHGLKKTNLKIDEKTIRDIINYYTREAGVRNLEREIANVCRKAARVLITNDQKSITINSKNLDKYLGTKKYRYDMMKEKDEVGIATGLAWTPVGGDTLSIEVNVMDGSGKLELTGYLGDVMKESARAAISYIRSRAEELSINKDFHKKLDIHIHVPEGATPKDGPSAGITMATALVSALSGYPVRKDVAMTGEITLRGRVLPIGGLKEKALAAYRSGIFTIIIPVDNKKDLDDIPENVKKKIKFVPADHMDVVLKTALNGKKQKKGLYELESQNDDELKKPSIEHVTPEVDSNLPTIEQ